jgi:hypothetical protein
MTLLLQTRFAVIALKNIVAYKLSLILSFAVSGACGLFVRFCDLYNIIREIRIIIFIVNSFNFDKLGYFNSFTGFLNLGPLTGYNVTIRCIKIELKVLGIVAINPIYCRRCGEFFY